MNLSRIRMTLWELRHILLAVAVLASLTATPSTIRGPTPATVGVVVVKGGLTPGTVLGSSNFTIVEVSAELAPEGLTRSLEDLNKRVLITSMPKGTLMIQEMTLSDGFLASVPKRAEIAPVVIDVGGADKLLTPGHTVTLYTPPGEHNKAREAVKIVDKATIVGVGPKNESTFFVSDSSHTSVLYVTVPQNIISLVIGYGSTMPIRVAVVR